MSRVLDRLPPPAEPRRMKVVIASCSRTGTLGLYAAMKTLGYKPYHMVEVVMSGSDQEKVLMEGIVAEKNRFSGIQRYDKADFDKWLGDYDCLIELASYLGSEAIEAYLQDPEVKFILTERDPDRWVASMNASVADTVARITRWPTNLLRHFDPDTNLFLRLNRIMYYVWSDATMPTDPRNHEALRRNYDEYIRFVKERVPADRLKVIKLEDGLGWEQICPFLDKPIPKDEYPRGNESASFVAMTDAYLAPMLQRAALRLAAVAVPAVGVGAWAAMKYGPGLYASWLR